MPDACCAPRDGTALDPPPGETPPRAPDPPLDWREHVGAAPLVASVVLLLVLVVQDSRATFESPGFLALSNVLFLGLLPMAVAVAAARGARSSGARSFLLMACGLFSFGFGNVLAVLLVPLPAFGLDAAVALHDVACLVAGLCHLLAGHFLLSDVAEPRPTGLGSRAVAAAFAGPAALLSLVAALAARGSLPVFFDQAAGPSPLRQCVLGGALCLFAASASTFLQLGHRLRTRFALWYSQALSLIALGTACALLQRAVGGPVGWLGQGTQCVGAVCLVLALVHGKRESSRLPAAAGAWTFWPYVEQALRARIAELDRANTALQNEVAARRRVEGELRISEDRLRHALRAARSAAWEWDFRRGALTWSDEFTELFGLPPGAAPSLETWRASVHPEDREVAEARLFRALRERRPLECRYRIVLPDAGVRWMVAHGTTSCDAAGQPERMLGICTDATKLWQADERHRNVLETAMDGFFICSPDGRLLEVNAALCALLGYSRAELLGLRVDQVDADHGPADVARRMAEVAAQGSHRFPSRYRAKDGGVLDVEVGVSRVTGDEGDFFVFVHDVGERKRAEAELRASESKYRALVETTDTGFLILDREGRVVDANREYVRLTGHRELGEILGRSVVEWTAPHARSRNAAAVAACARDGRIRDLVIDYAGPGGNVTTVEINATVHGEGESARFISLCRDVSERARSAEALRRSERRLRDAQAVGRIGDWELELATGKLSWSDEMYELWERDPALGPQPIAESMAFLAPEDALVVQEHQRRVLETGSSWEHDARVRLPSGREAWYRGIVVAARDGGGSLVRLSGVTQDITERRRAQEQLLTMQKLESLGVLAGGIAHDFNNLLTGLVANLSLLEVKLAGGSREQLELVRESDAACQAAKGLARQLLTFASGGDPIIAAADVEPVVQLAAALAARGSNVKVVVALEGGPVWARVDRDQLTQVVQNLVINAVQAMPQGGTVTVRLATVEVAAQELPPLAPGTYARIAVRDEGAGIPAELLPRVFDPYFSTKSKGRGLGLAVSRSILLKHRGSLGVESAPGGGATFTLHLPAAPVDAPQAARPAAPPPKPGTRILVMDDDEAVATAIGKLLGHLGCEFEVALEGDQAVTSYGAALAAGRPFAAVFLDLTVPGGQGGEEAVKRLKQLDPGVKAVVSSGYANSAVMADHAAYGFCAVLPKPYKLADVAAVLARVLEQPR